MTKKLIRSIMIGFCVFAATVIIAYFTCMATYRISAQRAAKALAASEPTVSAEPSNLSTAEPSLSYYIARLDGRNLSVYSCTSGKEEFLYTLDARIEDISEQELTELKKGIILKDKQALASFEEDFTS